MAPRPPRRTESTTLPDSGAPTHDGATARPDGSTSSTHDGGPSTTDAGHPAGRRDFCAERSAQIAAVTGNVIHVSPASDGQVMVDGSLHTLREVVSSASSGDIILLEDGTYTFPEASAGSYTGLYFTQPNVTMRSASGDPTAVVLDSNYADHGRRHRAHHRRRRPAWSSPTSR